MTKFELPEKPKKTNTSEDFNNLRKAVDELDKFDYAWKAYANKADRRINAANKYIEELERENQRLVAENLVVKTLVDSPNQQQALPVVSEFVAEFVSGDENELSKADRIAYLLKSVETDNYYLEEYLTNAGIISQDQGEHLYAWVTNQTHETILKLWNGYTVEKPQLFYIALPKIYGLSDPIFVSKAENGIISILTKGKDYALKLTEQEIKSIDERYWQFAVPVEDGE